MSRFRASSDLTRLNATAGRGEAVPIPWRLELALVAADRAHRVTAGRFDPRVLRDLERLGYAGCATRRAMHRDSRSGRSRIVASSGEARWRSTSRSTSVASARGSRSDGRPSIVERNGLDRFLLEAGGDLVARGARAGRRSVAGRDRGSRRRGGRACRDRRGHRGPSRRRRCGCGPGSRTGRPVHHLLDPRTGEPANGGLLAVTVHGPDPAWAEVWSKSLFIEGRVGIVATARARGLAAWWVTDDGTLEMTPAARERTAWVAGED